MGSGRQFLQAHSMSRYQVTVRNEALAVLSGLQLIMRRQRRRNLMDAPISFRELPKRAPGFRSPEVTKTSR
jgi:hypothetical protein